MTRDKDLVLITGAGGSLGTRLNSKISEKYTVIALDLDCGDSPDCYEFDISDSDSVRNALREVREERISDEKTTAIIKATNRVWYVFIVRKLMMFKCIYTIDV
jgi:dTDP-4-dehydrorhamnose reductase